MNIRSDHVIHYSICFWITALASIPYQLFNMSWMLFFPAVAGLIAGFYKEFKDIKTTGFDWTDIAADVLGIITALCFLGISMI